MTIAALSLLTRALAWVGGMAASVLLLASGVTRPLDDALYDLHMRHWPYPTSDRIIIVAIDPQSLARLGNWPWPRAVHARLLQRLTEAGVRGVGMDVTMSEPDVSHPDNDRLYAEAMRNNGRVVMPVFAEAAELGGVLEEVLPAPAIAHDAAAFGHVDASRDPDGVSRGVYLKAGLGQPQWPVLSLALYALGRPAALQVLPGLRRPHGSIDSPYQWARDDYVRIRFAGGAGAFSQVSYVDVLEGRVPAAMLKDRWILVGATAAGLGDQLTTAASASNEPMPGVEYQANILESLQGGRLITPLNLASQWLVAALLIALPLVLHGLPGFRRLRVTAAATLLFTLAASVLLLRMGSLWWPPLGSLVVVSLGLAVYAAMRRLERRRLRRDAASVIAEPWDGLGAT